MDLRTATLAEKTEIQINNILYRLHTSIPAIIISVDYDKQLLDAQIAVKLSTKEAGVERPMSYSPIKNIPFFTLQSGDFLITVPPKVGDVCMLFFSERNADIFWKTGKESISTFANSRRHNINDAVAIVGFNPIAKSIKNYDQNAIVIRDKNGDRSIKLDNTSINILSKGTKITINDNGVEIACENVNVTSKTCDIKTEKCDISSSGNLSITSGAEMLIKAQELKLEGNIININAQNQINLNSKLNIDGNVDLKGAMKVEGDFDVNLINGKPPSRMKNEFGVEEATSGTLTSGALSTWDIFCNLLKFDYIKFNFYASTKKIEISYKKTDVKSYDELITKINLDIQGVASVILKKERPDEPDDPGNSWLFFETNEPGREKGYIDYLESFEEIIEPTKGRLTTGNLGDFDEFKSFLNKTGLIFKIRSGSAFCKFAIPFDDINSKNSFSGLCDLINDFDGNGNKINAQFVVPNIIFETTKTGDFDGDISYLEKYSFVDSPTVLTGGVLDYFDSFVESLEGKDIGLKTSVNGNDVLFVCKNDQLKGFNGYNDFLSNVFVSDLTDSAIENNRITVATVRAGSSEEITEFSSVTDPVVTSTRLITGQQMSLEDLKSLFSDKDDGIPKDAIVRFYITCNEEDLIYEIDGNGIIKCTDYAELATQFTDQHEKNINVSFSIMAEKLVFESVIKGPVPMSPMKYNKEEEPEEGKTVIDGSLLFLGNETSGVVTIGLEVNNLCDDSAEKLKLTFQTGATIKNGESGDFSDNSIYLLKGTSDYATLEKGQDKKVLSINNTAFLLKGTKEAGAILRKGLDAGEDPDFEDSYDGIFTLSGDLKVTKKIICDEAEISSSLRSTGKIEFFPKKIEEEEEKLKEEEEEESVIINGGLIAHEIKSKDITVSKEGTIDKLIVNSGAEIHGDIKLSDGAIKSGGVTLKFDGSGLHSSKNIHAPDVFVND